MQEQDGRLRYEHDVTLHLVFDMSVFQALPTNLWVIRGADVRADDTVGLPTTGPRRAPGACEEAPGSGRAENGRPRCG